MVFSFVSCLRLTAETAELAAAAERLLAGATTATTAIQQYQ